MKNITLKAIFASLLLTGLSVNAQEKQNRPHKTNHEVTEGVVGPDGFVRCLTVEHNEDLRQQGLVKETKEEFENWLAPKIEAYKSSRLNNAAADHGEIITIPVVIHIIHNGDPVNTDGTADNENISYAQAISQIEVLNEDYRRIAGTPGAGTSGYGLGVDTEIQFCLAQQDPQGNPTNGVNRIDMGQESWTKGEVTNIVKPATIWDPERYMNMWSVKFGGANADLLGYAQFPSSSGLNGINVNGGPAETDGVVSNYNAFGTIAEDDGSFVLNNSYNLGRTMTHEVGHWLGLRHIWGDNDTCNDGANAGDYVVDTPASSGSNFNCDTEVESCGSIDMVENYMDYTYDYCMDTFTEGQKTRMLTVLANSPRRNTLGASTGCEPAEVFDLDGAINIFEIENPACSPYLIPVVELKNWGNNTLTSVEFSYYAEGDEGDSAVETFEWTGSLETNDMTIITLDGLTLESGSYVVHVEISELNGMPDERPTNNTASMQGFVNESYATGDVHLELVPDNYGSEITWTFEDGNGTLIASGGPYTDEDSTPVNEIFDVVDGMCYTFTIYDAYGDGICCAQGFGYFELTTGGGDLIYDGSSFNDFSVEVEFLISDPLSVNDNEFASGIVLHPNPSSEMVNVTMKNNELPSSIKIYNMLGQVMLERKVNSEADLTMNVASFSNGVYFVKVEQADKAAVLQFIKK